MNTIDVLTIFTVIRLALALVTATMGIAILHLALRVRALAQKNEN